jgi:uncharacterized protein YjiS (DUF1127 family)
MSAIQLRLHGAAAPIARRPLGPIVRRLFGRAMGTLGEWNRRMRDREALAALDERMLKDIGATRAEVQFIVNKPFWRE